MHARSSVGKRSDGTLRRLDGIASPATPCAGRVSAKLCCTGPTTVARFEVCRFSVTAALRRLRSQMAANPLLDPRISYQGAAVGLLHRVISLVLTAQLRSAHGRNRPKHKVLSPSHVGSSSLNE